MEPVLEAPSPEPIVEFVDEPRPVRWRDAFAVLMLIVMADLAIYRGGGFAGYALLFLLAPISFALGSHWSRARRWSVVFALLLGLLAARLIWCGSWLSVGCGFFCIVAFTMCLAGQTPQILSLLAFSGQSFAAGAIGINQYGESARRDLQPLKSSTWIPVVMPMAALALFGTIFILANPDVVSLVSKEWHRWLTRLSEWLIHFSIAEIPLWIATAWVSVGLMRPLTISTPSTDASAPPAVAQSAALYSAFRNTLVAVSGLYAVYLVFEFQTLWFREFPKGFHYSGYAHEGAAWLTCALALATLLLSLIFRGQMLHDPRLPRLKTFAWVWSALNLLLAIAVFNRLTIYVGFNGMTQMRMVGYFGTAAVVLGFLLAVVKIARHRSFLWLIRADLWALTAVVIVYALTPVDLLVMRYNTARIMAGDSAPSVQITVQSIEAEGVRELLPLIECRDKIVREGVLAMFAARWRALEATGAHQPLDITRWKEFSSTQISERWLVEELTARGEHWLRFDANLQSQHDAWQRFTDYAYQWY